MKGSETLYDAVIVGAGHAGIEAALACARLGLSTLLITQSFDAIANLPCNPAIGGSSKGHLVREIDALGGEMGRSSDAACIQYRLLGRSKGPAVWSLRAQADRRLYQSVMRKTIENQPGLALFQAEVVDILRGEDGAVTGVVTHVGLTFSARAVILATGTSLRGKITTGDYAQPGGPDGLRAAAGLSERLLSMGLSLQRFKTGTPPRLDSRTVDFTQMDPQPGDLDYPPFSFMTKKKNPNSALCYLTYTNEKTHRIIRDNLHRSPLYSGRIDGTGARYCPSIEDKVVRFADKKRHPVFIEPMGLDSRELYAQGLSSSLPADVQIALLRTIPGLESAEMTRPAYAIEYDCANPLELNRTLMYRNIPGLFGAGQYCGTSGYEEAAALGLLAGINAVLWIRGASPLILGRDEAYIGILVDDLVTKGASEPYRMMTSRAEYRLLLRQDNADERLTEHGFRIGLISESRRMAAAEKYAAVENEVRRLGAVYCRSDPVLEALLRDRDAGDAPEGTHLDELLKRPRITYQDLLPLDPNRPQLSAEVIEQVELRLRYGGYIARQRDAVARVQHMEARPIPSGWDYSAIPGLRTEAAEKLARVRPETLGQAARISGVSPADITALLLRLDRTSKTGKVE